MINNIPYWQKLQDPKWQRKRLEILSRDNWRCVICKDRESRLEVHHKYYVSGREPWEYPDTALETNCYKCHKEHAGKIEQFERDILLTENANNFFQSIGLGVVADSIHCYATENRLDDSYVFTSIIKGIITSLTTPQDLKNMNTEFERWFFKISGTTVEDGIKALNGD